MGLDFGIDETANYGVGIGLCAIFVCEQTVGSVFAGHSFLQMNISSRENLFVIYCLNKSEPIKVMQYAVRNCSLF